MIMLSALPSRARLISLLVAGTLLCNFRGQAMIRRWSYSGLPRRVIPYRPAPVVVAQPPPVVIVPVDPVQAENARRLLEAQRAAVAAAQNRRNAIALVGADERVVAFLRKRIDQGSADAAAELAQRHEEGRGVPADPVEARRLYRLAAERGNEDAQYWLRQHQ